MVLIILLGGCQVNKDETSTNPSEIDKDGLPEVRAFNDSFTREFLQSTEETREGYYPFVSGTRNYKMDFPSSGVIGDRSYIKKKNEYEEFPIHIKEEIGRASCREGERMVTGAVGLWTRTNSKT